MPDDVGDEFQRKTKYHRDRMPMRMLDFSSKPPVYKVYPEKPQVELPPPESGREMSLEEVLTARKSVRDFSDAPITTAQLSFLLWATTGIQRREHGYELRTAPSAGALYPIETYVVANNVEGLREGLYHYSIQKHSLEELRTGNLALEVARAGLDQAVCYEAAAVFIWSAVFYRSKWKYEQRGYRYIYMDVGHIGENLYLAAMGEGLGVCTIGALFDDELNAIIGVDGVEESVIYMAAIGQPA